VRAEAVMSPPVLTMAASASSAPSVPAQGQDGQGREGENPQAAELDQEEKKGLAPGGEVACGVHDDEASDAYGAGGREESVHPGQGIPRVESWKELQPQGPGQDQAQEGDGQEPGRSQAFPKSSQASKRHP
jgi:hypothetical protein